MPTLVLEARASSASCVRIASKPTAPNENRCTTISFLRYVSNLPWVHSFAETPGTPPGRQQIVRKALQPTQGSYLLPYPASQPNTENLITFKFHTKLKSMSSTTGTHSRTKSSGQILRYSSSACPKCDTLNLLSRHTLHTTASSSPLMVPLLLLKKLGSFGPTTGHTSSLTR